MTDTHANQSTLVIEADGIDRNYWRDMWRYRELLFFLVWRDIVVRYKQTHFGLLWAIARPLLTMLVFTLVFSKLANLPSEGAPYAMLVFTGLLPWQFFTSAFSGASDSLAANTAMMSKIYFPRLLFPASALIVSFVDLLISLVILFGLMIWYGIAPNSRLLILPIFIFIIFAAAMGLGLWIAALKVKYRDLGIIAPILIQFGMYASPVMYSSTLIPEKWRLLYSINPMAGVIDGFRWTILGGNSHIYWPGFLLSLALVMTILITGVAYFRKTEQTFVDVI